MEGDDPVWTLLESHMESAKSARDENLVNAMPESRELFLSEMRAACLLNLPICVLESDCTNIEQQKKEKEKKDWKLSRKC